MVGQQDGQQVLKMWTTKGRELKQRVFGQQGGE